MKLNNDKLKNVLKLTCPLIIIVVLFASAVSLGIVSFGPFSTDVIPEKNDGILTTATVILDYGDNGISSYAIYTKNNTVYGFLMEAARVGDFDVKTTYYSGFDSLLVDSIGDKTSGQDNKYWSYYINGEYGTIGADKQVVHGGDVIKWKFEGFEF